MKQHGKLLACVLLLALLVSMFAACGSSNSSSSTTTTTTSTSEETTATAAEETTAGQEEAAEVAAETVAADSEQTAEESQATVEEEAAVYSITYPLTGDNLTLTYWMPFKSPHDSVQTFDEFPVLATAEELTGVSITFISESQMTATEKFNLMVAAGDYCDLIGATMSYYTGNYEEAVDDGIAIDLSGLIEEYAPDYYAMLMENEDNYKAVVNDDGIMVAIYSIKDQYFPVMGSTVIRLDWLDELGYDAPNTVEELDAFLRDVQVTYGANYAIMLNYSNYLNLLSSSYGIGGGDASDGLYQVNGEVRYTYVQPEYKEYLEIAAAWYADGIISGDFMNVGTTGLASEVYSYIYSGDTAVISATASEVASIEAETGDGCVLAGYNLPAADGSGQTHFTDLSLIKTSEHATITEQCENPEVALAWLNFWYTEYGAIVANYGTEGSSFVFDEEGNPQWTELVTNNEWDLAANRASAIYSLYAHTTPIHTMETRLSSTFDDKQIEIYEVWMTGIDGDYLLPAVSLTEAESNVARSPLADIETYVEENVAKFINGSRSLDEWDDYVADIETLGLQKILDAYQSALDRYNLRGAN